ncbi:MAG TPA: mucoidy inhibitor-like protein, partial [Cytophagales bacterium]|nr:mucoidy inhibitor-like protein [Cytophagales bacterium]
ATPMGEASPAGEDMAATSSASHTTLTQTTLSAEYEISIPYTIPSSGRQEVVEIQQYSLSAFYQHSTVPKVDNDAFLLAGLTGWDKLNLLPGNSNIYFENTYVGQAYIDPQNTSDTLYVSLGRDKKVVVKRENVKDFTSKKTLGTFKKDEYAYEIVIRNGKSESIFIELEDQLPISKNSDIEVEVLDKGEGNYNSEFGKLLWKLKINPSETKKLRFRFSVKYPKNKQIMGL